MAVIIATGLVWPHTDDLIVALGIAALYLYSAWDIIRNARKELAELPSGHA